ncbi:MAG TPA: L-threonylcarbamoyladenylate synthase [Stellaceae bacterium]|nr:L-threonylcarbamoyladenylate synthase [Stellaceae bacterium]
MDGGPRQIFEAAERLRNGELVAFPTETVYGLGGDATDDRAVARIFAAKGRPRFNPLIVHLPDREAAGRLGEFTADARRLADLYWPGPLTLVLKRTPDCRASLLVSAGLDSIAVRVPAHPLAQTLLRAAGRPIAAPSANRSGRISPTTAEHVRSELGRAVSMILDGGPCRLGIESTVVDLSGPVPRLLRPGGVAQAALEAVLGPLELGERVDEGVARASPGLSASHYAPLLPVRLDAVDRRPGEAFVAFGPPPAGIEPDVQLSAKADLTEAAAKLFATLRAFDRKPFTTIAVMAIPETGLGAAINDRLRRAAAPRG